MKQILQNLNTGEVNIVEVPSPNLSRENILIQTVSTLISAGTEKMMLDFGKAGWLDKAKQQPDKVKQVLDKVKTDGIFPTIDAVKSKLDQPLPLGYCNCGIVTEIENSSTDLKIGNRVVSNCHHAQIVTAPINLCAKVPDNVSSEKAAFTVAGAIGLQGLRLAQPTIGECFVVMGLGLIGQLTVQLLISNGCRVLAIDLDTKKCELAESFGAEILDLSKDNDPISKADSFSKGRGIDGVIITASTKSSDPVHHAAQMCRKRGRIVLVGVTGLELRRSDFYEKELSFQVSCSYGPGRYDSEYEDKGHDYPIGFVRWTEKRNFESVLDLMASGKLNIKPLISHRFEFEKAKDAYELISNKNESYLGIILNYKSDEQVQKDQTVVIKKQKFQQGNRSPGSPVIGMIGAGNFTGRTLLPALKKTNAVLKTIVSNAGVTGTHLGKKFGFSKSSTDADQVFNDPEINTIFITTRHNTHADFVLKALKNGKNIFVEKPLCLTLEELGEIRNVCTSLINKSSPAPLLMTGFNRRFAPHIIKMKELLNTSPEPKSLIMTVNAGFIPKDSWIQDRNVGGGRIIGEACHFFDLLRFLIGHPVTGSHISQTSIDTGDTSSIQLSFSDGSIGTIHYFSNGNKSFPKERLEAFCSGKVIQLDDFRKMRGYGWKSFSTMNLWKQDKGHNREIASFINAVTNNLDNPIPADEIFEVMETTIELSRG